MRAFITGATGQDGSYLVEHLVAEGVEVHALSHRGDLTGHAHPDVVTHQGDVADVDATRRLVLDLAPDQIFNLAALSSVALSWERPDLAAAVNGVGAVGLLESAWCVQQRHDKEVRFIQASSAEIFGQTLVVPQDEETPLRPVSPYGAAKAYAHLMVEVYRRRGLHASAMVLYNHESPRRPIRFVTRKITAAVAAIERGEQERLTLGNLDVRRDWGWAPDYVDAMVRAANSAESADYVIATGKSHSLRDFVTAAFAHVGIEDWSPLVEVDSALIRPADPAELVGDASRAHSRLGWSPTVEFGEIVRRMVDVDRV